MTNQKNQQFSPFQEVHKKIQEARELGCRERERDKAVRKEKAETEAEREGFDRA